MIGLVVEDMAASLAFYRRLGFDLPPEKDTEPHVEAALPGGMRFGWDTVATIRSFDPDYTKSEGGNNVGLAFLCESPAAVDKTHADLVAAGYQSHKDPWDAFWGQRYACIEDPDGNVVDLFAPL
jgi:catechol 2,3-dioxygenase-like lactoylglutathione lyase family enzyme